MAKTATTPRRDRPAYSCAECGLGVPKWVGRCPECQAWGTIDEVGGAKLRTVSAGPVSAPARPIAEVDIELARARPSGVGELDRVLGGGLVPGAVILVAGEPGVGKSTLLLEVAASCAAPGARSLVITGEESAAQVRLRAGRTGALDDNLYLAAETDLAAVLTHIDAVAPSLLIVDSVQTISCSDIEGTAGGVTQVRQVAAALIAVAKERGIATVLVGHVTKDGSIAGPRVLEHLVDVVLSFEGERHTSLRLVRAVKNRFGATDEVGCFELTDGGIRELPDPSGMFLSRHDQAVSGTCVTVSLEGSRPLVAEVQSLVGSTAAAGSPRRATSGLDNARLAMVLAVLERRAQLKVSDRDVYAATVGGVRLTEPASDLALALAVASAHKDKALPPRLVVLGEVGLAGEVRPVQGIERRLAEASRLGFTAAIIPVTVGKAPPGLTIVEVTTLHSALVATHLL